MAVRSYRLHDPGYPARLRALDDRRPRFVSIEGDFDDDERTTRIAVVGSRRCHPLAARFAADFAEHAARAGAVILSGGAIGVDRAAHEGAMRGKGRTWSVLGCGHPHVWPEDNADLFPRIVASGGALIRPFPDGLPPVTARFLARNRVLCALADAVLVVQAGKPSGALSSANYALALGRPLWVVPPAFLFDADVEGSKLLMQEPQAHLVHDLAQLAGHFGIPLRTDTDSDSDSVSDSDSASVSASRPALSDDERAVLRALSFTPKHPDQLSLETGLPASAVSTALLTLALGDVVVEGSSGLFQRRKLVSH